MLVFAKENLILYSMPKTGTTSVDEALANRSTIKFSGTRNGGLKHISPIGFRKWERSLKKQFPDKTFESCCVMREPIEWLGSWYRYRKRDALKNNPRYLGDITFNDFLGDLCNKKGEDSSTSNLLNYQSRFLTRKNKFIIDRIFPYDKFQLFISYLNNKFNTKISLPQKNVSPTAENNELEVNEEISEKIKEFTSLDCQIYKKIMELDSYDSSNQKHVTVLKEILNKDSKS